LPSLWGIRVAPLMGIKRIEPGDQLGEIVAQALRRNGLRLIDDDVVVVTQKVVSKSEGRLVRLDQVKPTKKARDLALELGKDPKMVELVLRESRRVVRNGHGVLITETRHGFVCANSGVDVSNVKRGYASLLPIDPDASARRIRKSLEKATGRRLAVIVTDTFGSRQEGPLRLRPQGDAASDRGRSGRRCGTRHEEGVPRPGGDRKGRGIPEERVRREEHGPQEESGPLQVTRKW
jgi:F420-0:gamma-glutamyl ligase